MLTPIKIDNRINAHLGIPDGIGKRPVIIHMHERYGIVQHTTDLGEKYVNAGYVTIVPDYFSRFTGDRKALAEATTAASSMTKSSCRIPTRSWPTCTRCRRRT